MMNEQSGMALALKQQIKKRLPGAARAGRSFQSAWKQHRSKGLAKGFLKERKELWVEVGAGDKAGTNGWITIDVTPNCDLFWDLRKGLPFPDGSIRKIYSSHFFEHLSYGETQQFLAECRRAMADGGEFLICVPNARLYLEAYVKGETLAEDKYMLYKPAFNQTTRMDYVNYTAYMAGEHKYMFDQENLLFILTRAGFRNARQRPIDPTLDRQDRDFESIYARAEK